MALDPTLPAFFLPPNWGDQLLERVQFRTDAIASEDYTTQTRATRLTPRRSFEYSMGADGDLRRRFANTTYARGAGRWYLPVWTDGVELLAPASAGSDTIGAVTAGRSFVDGGVMFIQSPDLATFELIEIDSANPSTVSLAGALANDYPSGSMVYPALRARIDQQFSQSAFTGSYGYGRVKFNVAEPNHFDPYEWPTMHLGFPVLEDRPETTRDPDTVFQWMLDGLDDEIGIPSFRDPAGIPLYRQAHDWSFTNREGINRFRAMIYALQGKQRSIWVPTWSDDLLLSGSYISGTGSMLVRPCGAPLVAGKPNRRALRWETNTGVYYARTTAAVDSGLGYETLTLNPPFEFSGSMSTVQMSWMALCRSETDNFEFNWTTGETADVAMAWRARQNDL